MNREFATLVPVTVVTSTLTALPAVPAGVVAVMLVELTTVTLVAATPPMVTPVAPVKSAPVIVMTVPPTVEPVVGEILFTVGAGAATTMLATCTEVLVPPKDVTTAVRLPRDGAVSKVTINWVEVAEVTWPVPLLKVTVFILGVGTKSVPAMVTVVALDGRSAMLDVIVGVETATVGMFSEEKGLVQPFALCR